MAAKEAVPAVEKKASSTAKTEPAKVPDSTAKAESDDVATAKVSPKDVPSATAATCMFSELATAAFARPPEDTSLASGPLPVSDMAVDDPAEAFRLVPVKVEIGDQ